MIQFTVDGEPQSQGRPRFSTVNGHAKAYDPEKSRDYKAYVKHVASQHKPDKPLEGALCLEVNVYRSIPKSFSQKKRKQAENGVIRPITKPDGSNYLKLIEDAGNKLIWGDDSQLVDVRVRKWYSEKPRIEVRCYRLKEGESNGI